MTTDVILDGVIEDVVVYVQAKDMKIIKDAVPSKTTKIADGTIVEVAASVNMWSSEEDAHPSDRIWRLQEAELQVSSIYLGRRESRQTAAK